MYRSNMPPAGKILPICGVLAKNGSKTCSKSLVPVMNTIVNRGWARFRVNRELLASSHSFYPTPRLFSIHRSNFYSGLGFGNGRLLDYLRGKYTTTINNNKGNIRLGVSAGLISLLLYILSMAKEKNNKNHLKSGFGSNMATKYILNIINDPNIEDSLKKLIKRVLTSLVKDEDFSKDWRQSLRHIIKECEDEIGQNLTNVLKTKIVQDWLYSTTNEIVDYMSRTPDIISKTSSLFSEAFNHQIFTDNSKKWLEEFIQNCVINNKKIIQSINHLLTRIFNTKDIQNNLSELFKDVILNDSTQDYISLAFWNVIRKSLLFPKNWFNGIKSSENYKQHIDKSKKKV